MTYCGLDDLICLEVAYDMTLTSISPALIWLDDLATRTSRLIENAFFLKCFFHLSKDKLLPSLYLAAWSFGMENDVQYWRSSGENPSKELEQWTGILKNKSFFLRRIGIIAFVICRANEGRVITELIITKLVQEILSLKNRSWHLCIIFLWIGIFVKKPLSSV